MEETEKIQHKLPSQEIDYFKIGKILLSRWYWIAASVAICYIWANVYLWYTPKTYATSATMKLEEKKSELTEAANLTTPDRGLSRVQTETFVIQSPTVILNAIRDMDYRVSFYLSGRIRTTELYPQKPLNIQLIKFDSTNFYHGLISFKPQGNSAFHLSYNSGNKKVEKTVRYDAPVSIENMAFSIKNPGYLPKEAVFLFKFNTPEDFLGRVSGGLRVSEAIKYSNIISLQETDSNPQFAADALNAIMTEYLRFDRLQKTLSATQMIHFIQTQMDTLSLQLKGSENRILQSKQNSGIIDVASASQDALGRAKDLGSQRTLLNLQLIAIDQLKQQIISEKDNITLNFNLEGTLDPLLSGLITELNGLIIRKEDLSKTYIPSSKVMQDVNQQLLEIKNASLNNIAASRLRIQKSIQYIDQQISSVNQQISSLPETEQKMIGLNRNFEINDKVYSFLSEKKLDAQISRAAILPGATIINAAEPNFSPVSPDETGIKHSAIILGLGIGLGLIILIRILNPYIYDKETIESLTTIPIIGVIRKSNELIKDEDDKIPALSKPRSIFAESVRSVRTNLNFLAAEKTNKVICISSEVAGEGKSFVAVNLAGTLSLIDKKVILVAADLRRSKLHRTFNVVNDKGLSNYLAHQCSVDDIICHVEYGNLDFIPSGAVPPNPSELLHSIKMKEMIDYLKLKYDIVMIDTAPIGLVSDSIPLIRMSDINLFVIRSGKSKFYAATVPQRIAQEYNLSNTVIVLNAYEEDLLHSRYYTTKFTGGNYGTRYYYYSDYSGYANSGYYLDSDKPKWWHPKRWFKK
jgi:capsular exopolysaccharide synthesis family protein